MRCVLPLWHALAPCMVHGIGMHVMHVMHVMHHMIIIMFIMFIVIMIVDHHHVRSLLIDYQSINDDH